jgi:hypothetical protein
VVFNAISSLRRINYKQANFLSQSMDAGEVYYSNPFSLGNCVAKSGPRYKSIERFSDEIMRQSAGFCQDRPSAWKMKGLGLYGASLADDKPVLKKIPKT